MRFKSDLQIRSLLDLVECFQSSVVKSLFTSPAICLIFFRELSPDEQTIITRLLFVDQPFVVTMIETWFQSTVNVSLHRLRKLKVLVDIKSSIGPTVMVDEDYKLGLKQALAGRGTPWDVPQLDPDPKIPVKSLAFLTSYATERWETLLQFMVGSEGSREKLSDETISILCSSGLIDFDMKKDSKPSLSASGFQFLLQETSAQVWYFLTQYFLRLNATDPEYLVEAMTFLFQMSQSTFGRDYSSEVLSNRIMNFVQFLRELGLVYMRKRRDGRFYPTGLAVEFMKGSKTSMTLGNQRDITKHLAENKRNKDGFIIIESNFRLYAYTDSDLHAALIAMFSVVCYRFPGCICCVITRESIRQSLLMGISADKILHYLLSHLHPQAGNNFPPTVIDQLRLWEMETGKMKFQEGVLYSNFMSHAQFQFLSEFASGLRPEGEATTSMETDDSVSSTDKERKNGVLYANVERRLMVVDESIHEPVKKHWKTNKSRFES